jgi:hypothetical protein
MEQNSGVNSFLEKLQSMSPATKKQNLVNRRILDKVFTNFKGNYGRYQILPMNSVVSDFPFVTLMNTREIHIPRRNQATDGTVKDYNAWIRLLPESAYTIKDPSSGNEVSSLTAAEEQLLHQAYTVYEELYKELDARNNAMDPVVSNLIRRKNYTIFHGYCVNQWPLGDTRNMARNNFSALFVVTAKGFIDKVTDSIQEASITSGRDSAEWLKEIYNRDLSGRKGSFLFSVSKAETGAGFNISVTHTPGANPTIDHVVIPEEDGELMSNPVETFLGWQARRQTEDVPASERRLFNETIIREAIEFMSDQLAKIRIAKQNNTSVKDAIEATNKEILEKQPLTNSRGQATNDPILAQMGNTKAENASGGYGENNVAANPEAVAAKNTNPYQNPPVSHMDPITGAPMTEQKAQQAPAFGQPSFGGFGNAGGNNLPF